VKGYLGRIGKGGIMTHFKVLLGHLPGWIKENYKNPESGGSRTGLIRSGGAKSQHCHAVCECFIMSHAVGK
jgi:hypothetical protein